MKDLKGKLVILVVVYAALFIIVNKTILKGDAYYSDKNYRVAINRIAHDLEEFELANGREADSLDELYSFSDNRYEEITGITPIDEDMSFDEAFEELSLGRQGEYELIKTHGNCYKVDYKILSGISKRFVFIVNLAIFISIVIIIAVASYIYVSRIRPYQVVSEYPYELAKGNLTLPLKENKNRHFGKFIWGLDLLREKLEDNKKKELELQREKKLLLVSLSHDVKTPLSAIKLYASALAKNLYKDEAKRQDIAQSIGAKADEIEGYISEIVKASNDDFINFDVNVGECYTNDIFDSIEAYYRDKMELNMISFKVKRSKNCLIVADHDRFVEVIQNIIENAIKYGDGRIISMNSYREDDEYHVVIDNSGCELQNIELPHIFDSFFRGSNASKKQGSGLGLYICRKLMHLMDGEITASIKTRDGERFMSIEIIARVA